MARDKEREPARQVLAPALTVTTRGDQPHHGGALGARAQMAARDQLGITLRGPKVAKAKGLEKGEPAHNAPPRNLGWWFHRPVRGLAFVAGPRIIGLASVPTSGARIVARKGTYPAIVPRLQPWRVDRVRRALRIPPLRGKQVLEKAGATRAKGATGAPHRAHEMGQGQGRDKVGLVKGDGLRSRALPLRVWGCEWFGLPLSLPSQPQTCGKPCVVGVAREPNKGGTRKRRQALR